jgi:hypothetical protein
VPADAATMGCSIQRETGVIDFIELESGGMEKIPLCLMRTAM